MRTIAISLVLLLFLVVPAYATHEIWHQPYSINSNPFNPDSINNPYGKYGSPYSPDSVNNPYGPYYNPYRK